MPDLFHPGHLDEQKSRMEQFDPFARTDKGPAIRGDRPNGCVAPIATEKYLKNMEDYRR